MVEQFNFGGYAGGEVRNISIPYVVEKVNGAERTYDLASRMMQDRIIFLDTDFNDQMAHIIKQQLVWLDSQGSEPITFYISSPVVQYTQVWVSLTLLSLVYLLSVQ
ncbi:UNVERIFIED_ORG: ATP-dependent Clp protease proteolytic subunit [Escherichia phage CMSTMSU]